MKEEIKEDVNESNSIIIEFSEEECKKIHEIIINIKELDKIPFKKHKWEKEIEKISEWQIESFNYNRFIPNKKPE
ncbi:MAG: hypothetical protein ACTSQO_03880 [Candidatus Helarchaeota archaeon]